MPLLDDRNVRLLPGPAAGRGEVIHWDDPMAGGLAGFGVRVLSSGRRAWVVRFRVGTAQRFVTLARIEALSVRKARAKAGDLLAQARLGSDPRAEIERRKRALAKPELTMRDLIDLYLERDAARRLGAASFAGVRHSLQTVAAPLHGLPPTAGERRVLAELVQSVAGTRGPRAADLFSVHLSRTFNWAIQAGIVDVNPAQRLPRMVTNGSRDRVLTPLELRAIWHLAAEQGSYGAILRLLILTGQRRQELGGMTWDEVDLDAGVWTLPGTRTKNRRAHVVPLSTTARPILLEAATARGGGYVFGLGGRAPFKGWSKCKARLDAAVAAAGVRVRPWVVHDLRRSAVTHMAEIGIAPHVIEAVVNHVSGHRAGVAGIYNRATYAAEKRDALQRWADHLQNLVDPRSACGTVENPLERHRPTTIFGSQSVAAPQRMSGVSLPRRPRHGSTAFVPRRRGG
ncbi:MAG: site-specific integrase [Geminicoccaceae bacterium]|nr:MAG: site-specific integrase [Geminicoccaceae bacterium]